MRIISSTQLKFGKEKKEAKKKRGKEKRKRQRDTRAYISTHNTHIVAIQSCRVLARGYMTAVRIFILE